MVIVGVGRTARGPFPAAMDGDSMCALVEQAKYLSLRCNFLMVRQDTVNLSRS